MQPPRPADQSIRDPLLSSARQEVWGGGQAQGRCSARGSKGWHRAGTAQARHMEQGWMLESNQVQRGRGTAECTQVSAGRQGNAGRLAGWQATDPHLQRRQRFIEVDGEADSGQVLAHHVLNQGPQAAVAGRDAGIESSMRMGEWEKAGSSRQRGTEGVRHRQLQGVPKKNHCGDGRHPLLQPAR